MNPPTQPTQLKPGDIRQAGDTISELESYRVAVNTAHTHTQEIAVWDKARPIAPHTYDRVILPADLINARFFRP